MKKYLALVNSYDDALGYFEVGKIYEFDDDYKPLTKRFKCLEPEVIQEQKPQEKITRPKRKTR